eukprot:TRINITY_DN2256_c0_g2_i2.p1 TRINITY_DN2256_c0_g2~~TRINITY_DN2256_c0_g2_i2.p1  ORF type:complete len:137 (-),score=23.50 TRINITY_DN2256_c0_g2_i2:54-464(-)
MWKNLTEDQKQKYRIMEAQDKIRYQQDKQHWERTYPEAAAQMQGDPPSPPHAAQTQSYETLPRMSTMPVQSMQPYPYSLVNAIHQYHPNIPHLQNMGMPPIQDNSHQHQQHQHQQHQQHQHHHQHPHEPNPLPSLF